MSLNWSLAEVAAELGALVGDDAVVHGVTTDSRTVAAGDLFVAIVGEIFDGHDYVADALAAGAVAAVVVANSQNYPQFDGCRLCHAALELDVSSDRLSADGPGRRPRSSNDCRVVPSPAYTGADAG